jgi:hypothetical protein
MEYKLDRRVLGLGKDNKFFLYSTLLAKPTEAHSVSYSTGTGSCFPVVKADET